MSVAIVDEIGKNDEAAESPADETTADGKMDAKFSAAACEKNMRTLSR